MRMPTVPLGDKAVEWLLKVDAVCARQCRELVAGLQHDFIYGRMSLCTYQKRIRWAREDRSRAWDALVGGAELMQARGLGGKV